jgi:Fe-S cluster biogenesis protein NfuA
MGKNCLKINTIEEFLDKNVRPFLASHNGNLEIISFKKGVLEIKLLGSCANCPASQETLDNKVIKLLEDEFSEIKEVKSVKGVSNDLINKAKEILKKR